MPVIVMPSAMISGHAKSFRELMNVKIASAVTSVLPAGSRACECSPHFPRLPYTIKASLGRSRSVTSSPCSISFRPV